VVGALVTCVATLCFLMYVLLQSNLFSDSYYTMTLAEKLDILRRISWFPGVNTSGGLEMQEAQVLVALVMGLSAFAQALTGFGFAVVSVGALSSMPWLLHSELYDVITPVAATLGAVVGFILLLPSARNLAWREILPLLVPCTVLTPVGVSLSSAVDPIVATKILAALILSFVAYQLYGQVSAMLSGGDDDAPPTAADALTTDAVAADALAAIAPATNAPAADAATAEAAAPALPAAIAFGSLAGIFGGAFDIQGPPLVVYGNLREWSPQKFRDNVLAVVALNSLFVVAIDFLQETYLFNFYYSYFCLTSLPVVLLGVAAGQFASKRIDPAGFKRVVLLMCLGLGVQLLTVQ